MSVSLLQFPKEYGNTMPMVSEVAFKSKLKDEETSTSTQVKLKKM
jgi:hypothetical protein